MASEWMIRTDESRRLRETVPLNHGVAETAPEAFRVRGQGSAARNNRPEFPAEPAMDRAEAPAALQKVFGLGFLKVAPQFLGLPARCKVALDLVLKRFDEPRHGSEQGDALVVNRTDDLGRVQRVQENRRGPGDLRQENAEQLTEDMAERQQIEEAQRMNNSFVASIALDFSLHRLQGRQQVSLGKNDTVRLRCRPRCKYNFDRIAALESRRG